MTTTDATDLPELLTYAEASVRYGVPESTLRAAANRGELIVVALTPRTKYVTPDAMSAYLASKTGRTPGRSKRRGKPRS